MSEPIRIGVVGCGNVLEVGYRAEIENLACRGLVQVVAACDRVEARRGYVNDVFGPAGFTTDYRELVRREDVELVLVLAPMQVHGEIACAALEAGKHTLLEKPIAASLAKANEVLAAARKSSGYLVCAPFVVLSPTFQTIWRRVRRGDIGPAYLARARYGWAGPWWSAEFYRAGGGALFDMAVYNITTLTGLLGPVRRVAAMTGIAIPERVVNGQTIQVEAVDNAQLLLDLGNACFAVVTTGFTMQQYRTPAVEIYGGEGTLQLLGDDWHPVGYELWLNSVGAWQIYNETCPTWEWTAGLEHLVHCIRQEVRPIPSPEHAYHVLEVMIRAEESGRQGRTLDIESSFPPPAIPADEETRPAHLVYDWSRPAR